MSVVSRVVGLLRRVGRKAEMAMGVARLGRPRAEAA